MQTDGTLIMVTRDGMGSADRELQHKLFSTWLTITEQNGMLPGAMAFYTDGVRLVCEGSPVLEQLERFEQAGVHLISCKTCLDSFALFDAVRVGLVGGMGDIAAAQIKATKVISL
jgi:hypothetical protein